MSRWNKIRIGHFLIGITSGMLISCSSSHFHLRWVAIANAVSGGIRAYVSAKIESVCTAPHTSFVLTGAESLSKSRSHLALYMSTYL